MALPTDPQDPPKPKRPTFADFVSRYIRPALPPTIRLSLDAAELAGIDTKAAVGRFARPAAKAAEEAVTTVVDVGADAREFFHKTTGIQADPDFQRWYDNLHGSERHGLQFGKWAEEAFGKKPEGWAGVAENLVQFGIGFYAASKILKAPSLIGKAGNALKLGRGILEAEKAGFVADFAFMDEYENNLLGIADNSPASVQNAVTRALAADTEDPATWNRLKNGLQGFVVGRALQQVLGSIKAVWLWRRAKALPLGSAERAALEGRIIETAEEIHTPQAAPAAETAATKEAAEVKPAAEAPTVEPKPATESKPFDVVEGEDGTFRFAQEGKEVADGPAFRTAGEANTAASSLNDFVAVPSEALQQTTKTIQERIASGANPADVAGLLDGTAFNFHWVQSPENARAWINAVAEVAPAAHETAKQSMEETARIAQEIFGGQTGQEALSIASDVLGKVEDLPAKVWGLRAYQHATAQYVAELSEKLDMGAATGLDADKLRISLGTLFQLNPAVKRLGTRVGQALNAFKGATELPGVAYADLSEAAKTVPLTSEAANALPKVESKAPASAGIFANMTATELKALARNIRLTGGDPAVVDHYVRNVLGIVPPKAETTAWGVFQAVPYNSLLSGPLTHSKNVFSNFAKFLMHNAELSSEGLRTGNKEMFHEGTDQLSALWLDSMESLRVAMSSVRQGKAVLEEAANKEGVTEAIENLAAGSAFSTPKRWLWQLWNAPSTMLMAEDEFFKQLNYRSSVRGQALRDARRLGLAPEKWAEYTRQTLDGAFTLNGAGINTTALELAKENTFTRELQGLAADGSELIGKSRFLSFFFPFRKTPVNVFLSAMERTPGLWRLSTQMRAELAGEFGAKRAAEAEAKLQMGQNLWLLATGLAASGHISGGGPKDKNARRQLLATGWKPYAFKAPGTDTWVSFQALEPFSTIMGIAADATEAVQDLSREARRKDFADLVGAFIMGTASNISNKSFLTGMQDMANLFSGRVSAGERIVSSLGRQLVPFGGLLGQTNPDDVQRDAVSVKERVLSGLPYFSEGVEPVRSILGKPLLKESWAERAFWPFTVSQEAGTPEQGLMRELLQGLGENVQIPLPSASLYNGLVDLRDRETWKRNDGKNQSPYDRMLELFGSGVGNLPPIQTALRAVVAEDHAKLAEIFGPTGYKFGFWKSARPKDGIDITDSDTRLGIVRGVLKEYREAAFNRVLTEYPELAKMEARLKTERTTRREDEAANRLKSFEEFTRSALP